MTLEQLQAQRRKLTDFMEGYFACLEWVAKTEADAVKAHETDNDTTPQS